MPAAPIGSDDLLYKYYANSQHAFDNIEKNELCLNDVGYFNDPFEGFGKHVPGIGASATMHGRPVPPFIRHRKLISEINHNYRIGCFTETYDNPLMWSHYTNSHQGFCVAYKKSEIEASVSFLEQVAYATAMPVVSGVTDTDVKTVLLTKSSHWDYEKEWRAVLKTTPEEIDRIEFDELKRLDYEARQKSGEGIPYYFWPRPSHFFKVSKRYFIHCKPVKFYFGLRMLTVNWMHLMDIVPGIEYFNMRQKLDSYDIEPIPQSPGWGSTGATPGKAPGTV
ncbi:DUF2971 domain-containing protein [Treponema primitia]|uniref:DUF2971 domain-containing protein n=1 Tax=Treponema primitia TaxID=88058 RepID=UPI0002554C11|nr:DUF2971 domain-containing protein [Treponema primitia]